jgi:hypothetical protein
VCPYPKTGLDGDVDSCFFSTKKIPKMGKGSILKAMEKWSPISPPESLEQFIPEVYNKCPKQEAEQGEPSSISITETTEGIQ